MVFKAVFTYIFLTLSHGPYITTKPVMANKSNIINRIVVLYIFFFFLYSYYSTSYGLSIVPSPFVSSDLSSAIVGTIFNVVVDTLVYTL